MILSFDKDGNPLRYKKGHQSKGHNHSGWKGGRILNINGYYMLRVPNYPYHHSGNYVLEHRLIMEQHLGRLLEKDEDVHHINGDIHDNHIENLKVLSHKEHRSQHWKQLMAHRCCIICGSKTTYIRPKCGWPQWHKKGDNYYCHECYKENG